MKFSIGIQATFTQPFLTGVMLENVKMSLERYCFSEFEKILFWKCWHCTKIFWNGKKKRFSKYQLIDKTNENEKQYGPNFTMWQSDQLFTNISI